MLYKKWCFSMFIKSLWLTLSLATVCEVTKIKAIQIHVLSILFYFMNRKSTIYLYSRTCLFIKGPMKKLFYNHNSVYLYWEFVMNRIYIVYISLNVCIGGLWRTFFIKTPQTWSWHINASKLYFAFWKDLLPSDLMKHGFLLCFL